MGEWQPIETAPKDGERVDLWATDIFGHGQRFADCYWQIAQWPEQHDRWVGLPEGRRNWNPTHWQPLPEPPSPNQQVKE